MTADHPMFPCLQCPREFRRRENLARHVRSRKTTLIAVQIIPITMCQIMQSSLIVAQYVANHSRAAIFDKDTKPLIRCRQVEEHDVVVEIQTQHLLRKLRTKCKRSLISAKRARLPSIPISAVMIHSGPPPSMKYWSNPFREQDFYSRHVI